MPERARKNIGRLDLKARLKIVHELRAAYNDCEQWELPKRLEDLLEQLGTVDLPIMPGRTRNLNLALTRTLKPNNWPLLVTLGDAVHYISKLAEGRRSEPRLEYAIAVLDRAAISGDENDVATATHAVAAVLARE